MSDEPKVVKFSFNEAAVREKFAAIESSVIYQQGKKGFNPFIWLRDKVNPLVNRFTNGERTEDLQKAIMSLPSAPPALNISKDTVPTEPINEAPQLKPTGIILPSRK